MTEVHSRRELPIAGQSVFSRAVLRSDPEHPSSWDAYTQHARHLVAEVLPPSPWVNDEGRELHINTMAACAMASEWQLAGELGERMAADSQTCPVGSVTHATYLHRARLDYWRTYNSLFSGEVNQAAELLEHSPATHTSTFLERRGEFPKEAAELRLEFSGLRTLLTLCEGDFVAARNAQQQVLDGALALYGKDHARTWRHMSRLAHTLRLEGDHTEALRLSEKVSDVLTGWRHYGEEHPLTIRNRFYALVDRLALGEDSDELRQDLDVVMIQQQTAMPEKHADTALMLADYSAAQLHLALTETASDGTALADNIYYEQAGRYADLALKLWKSKRYAADPEEAERRGTPLQLWQTLQAAGAAHLDTDTLFRVAMGLGIGTGKWRTAHVRPAQWDSVWADVRTGRTPSHQYMQALGLGAEQAKTPTAPRLFRAILLS